MKGNNPLGPSACGHKQAPSLFAEDIWFYLNKHTNKKEPSDVDNLSSSCPVKSNDIAHDFIREFRHKARAGPIDVTKAALQFLIDSEESRQHFIIWSLSP